MDYTKKLEPVESIFESYIAGKMPVSKLEEMLSNVLSSIPFEGKTKHFDVIMAKRTFNVSEPTFGISVFPSVNKMEELTEKLVVDSAPWQTLSSFWATIDDWTIEIDPRLMDRNTYALNHKELTACVLHEIGHTVYSDRILERMNRSFKGIKMSMKLSQKAATKTGHFIFMIPFMVACSGPNLVKSLTRGQGEERFADNMAVKCGYGDHLITAMDKLIKEYGKLDYKTTENELDKQVDASNEWAARMISDMSARRNKLANDVFSTGARSASQYIKRGSAHVMNLMGAGLKENYSGDAVESVLTIMEMGEAALESYSPDVWTEKFLTWESATECACRNAMAPATESIFKARIKQGLPSWRSVDELQIRIDRIRNTADRQMALDEVYQYIDDIQEFMELIIKNKHEYSRYKPEADKMLIVLNGYREQILGKHTGDDPTAAIGQPTDGGYAPPKNKGLFYAPAGYRG